MFRRCVQNCTHYSLNIVAPDENVAVGPERFLLANDQVIKGVQIDSDGTLFAQYDGATTPIKVIVLIQCGH